MTNETMMIERQYLISEILTIRDADLSKHTIEDYALMIDLALKEFNYVGRLQILEFASLNDIKLHITAFFAAKELKR